MLSANDIFYVSALVFLLLIAVVWLARPPKAARRQTRRPLPHTKKDARQEPRPAPCTGAPRVPASNGS